MARDLYAKRSHRKSNKDSKNIAVELNDNILFLPVHQNLSESSIKCLLEILNHIKITDQHVLLKPIETEEGFVLVYLYKRLVSRGLTLSVIGLRGQPADFFTMLHLDKAINCYRNLDEYLRSFRVSTSNEVVMA